MKRYIYPLLAVLVFLVIQGMCAIIMVALGTICSFLTDDAGFENIMSPSSSLYIMVLSLATIVSGLISAVVVSLFMHMPFWQAFKAGGIKWVLALLAIVCSIFGILASDTLSELLDLPDLMKSEFIGMAKNPCGILAVALVGPLVEEYIMRYCVMGYMLRRGIKPLTAILFSAFLFGIMHINPAQVPFAFIMGVIFGVIYYKTGNIIVSSVLHVLNNSVSVILMAIYGERSSDITISGAVGTPSAIAIIIVGSILCVVGLRYFWMKHPTAEYEDRENN